MKTWELACEARKKKKKKIKTWERAWGLTKRGHDMKSVL
jgi:hypothetical protein